MHNLFLFLYCWRYTADSLRSSFWWWQDWFCYCTPYVELGTNSQL